MDTASFVTFRCRGGGRVVTENARARELFEAVRAEVQGLQVSAPFGKVPFALEVFEAVESVSAAAALEPA